MQLLISGLKLIPYQVEKLSHIASCLTERVASMYLLRGALVSAHPADIVSHLLTFIGSLRERSYQRVPLLPAKTDDNTSSSHPPQSPSLSWIPSTRTTSISRTEQGRIRLHDNVNYSSTAFAMWSVGQQSWSDPPTTGSV